MKTIFCIVVLTFLCSCTATKPSIKVTVTDNTGKVTELKDVQPLGAMDVFQVIQANDSMHQVELDRAYVIYDSLINVIDAQALTIDSLFSQMPKLEDSIP